MKRIELVCLTISTILFSFSIKLLLNSHSQQKTIIKLALKLDVKDTKKVEVLPKILSLGENAEPKEAIAYYNLAIETIDKLDRSNLSKNEKEKVERFLERAANKRSSIAAKKLSTIEQQLKTRQFGKINDLVAGEFENQYTPGAIQTTYELLMSPSGLHADANNDGFISSQTEVDRVPCRTLIDLENLWRKYTGSRCGWFGESSKYVSDRCSKLSITGVEHLTNEKYKVNLTLLNAIFKLEDFYFVEPKIDHCLKLD